MNSLSSVNPLEIWNRRVTSLSSSRKSSSGYESIPDHDDDDVRKTKTNTATEELPSHLIHAEFCGRINRNTTRYYVVLAMIAAMIVLLGSFTISHVWTTTRQSPSQTQQSEVKQNHQQQQQQHPQTSAAPVRPHFTPTLLQVVENNDDTTVADRGRYVYALNNTLYNEMLHPTTQYLDVTDDDNNNMSRHELPQLLLDTTTIDRRRRNNKSSMTNPITLTWTVGRNVDSGQTLIQDDDIIALYCNNIQQQSYNDYNDDENSHDVSELSEHDDDDDDDNPSFEADDIFNQVPGHAFLEAATISQIRYTSLRHGGTNINDNSWYLPDFPILRQDLCHFRLYTRITTNNTNDDNEGEVNSQQQQQQLTFVRIASSEPIRFIHAKTIPSAIHLALTDHPSKMIVQFTTGDITTTTSFVPVVRFTPIILNDNDNDNDVRATTSPLSSKFQQFAIGTTDTYHADDLCQYPANTTEAGKFYPPGLLHTIQLTDLQPSTVYRYQVGVVPKSVAVPSSNGTFNNANIVWSDTYQFRSSPNTKSFHRENGTSQSQEPFSYIVYGDQGCPSDRHCSQGQKWMKQIMEHEPPPLAVHHFGDISYANGAAHIWDAWFEMIRPFSISIPLMVSIGNHEYDHLDGGGPGKDLSGVTTAGGYKPEWGDMQNDSGGECGTPMAKRFRMPSSKFSNGVFWYSFDFANVHTIVISGEHDLSQGSPQFDFLLNDLKTVDRSITPWLVLEVHRPLYEGERGDQWMSNTRVGEAMRREIEDLLYDYDVDIVLGGHYHEYHRTCDRLYQGECNSTQGPIHITLGAAGAPLDDFYSATYDQPWTASYLRGVFGYGKMNVKNDTAIRFEFISYDDNQVRDEVWIMRDR